MISSLDWLTEWKMCLSGLGLKHHPNVHTLIPLLLLHSPQDPNNATEFKYVELQFSQSNLMRDFKIILLMLIPQTCKKCTSFSHIYEANCFALFCAVVWSVPFCESLKLFKASTASLQLYLFAVLLLRLCPKGISRLFAENSCPKGNTTFSEQ